jgi:hypothetical protein
LAIFAFNGLRVCRSIHAVPRQRAVAIQLHGRIQRSLSAQSWQTHPVFAFMMASITRE